MRLTPAQLGMHGLRGRRLPMWNGSLTSLVEVVRHGHDDLVVIAGVDLGYDPWSWHERLRETDLGGYRWSNLDRGFRKRISTAMADAGWTAAVAELTRSPGAEDR